MVTHNSSGLLNQQISSPVSLLGSFFRQSNQYTDEFVINPAYDQQLTDQDGGCWLIPAQALRDQHGHVPGKNVCFRISSISDPREALLAGYTISSGERPLQTSTFFSVQAGILPTDYRIIHPLILSDKQARITGPLSIYAATPSDIVSNNRHGMLSWKKIDQAISSFKFGRKRSMELSIPGSGIYALAQQLPARLSRTMITVRAYGLPTALHEARAFLLIDANLPPLQLHQTAPMGFTGFNLPSGKAAWLLIAGTRNEQFFYGLRRLTALDNRVESIALQPIQPDQLKDLIQNILL